MLGRIAMALDVTCALAKYLWPERAVARPKLRSNYRDLPILASQ